MTINGEMTLLDGSSYKLVYEDYDNFNHLNKDMVRQSYGVCFCQGKIVLGYRGKKATWGIIGGTIETGETFEQALAREITEESNMKLIKSLPIGYQTVTNSATGEKLVQLRYACLVESLGPFISDPAGSITKIMLVEPADYKKYMDWGEIGDRIIKRGVEIYNQSLKQ